MNSTYQRIKTIFSDQKCTLHNEEEILNQIQNGVQFKKIKCFYYAQCGHSNMVSTNNFLYRNSGRKCKDCTYNEIRCKSQQNSCKNNSNIQEQNTQHYIEKIINSAFEVKHACEGCKIDFAIKPKNVLKDQWLPVQLKTTQKLCHGQYKFHIQHSYEDMLMMFYCIEENRFWICFYDDIEGHPKHLNFRNSEKSKFNSQFEIQSKDLINFLNHAYFLRNEYIFGDLVNVPSSKTQIKEVHYSDIRKNAFSNSCDFHNPLYHQIHYDFIVNNCKVRTRKGCK